MMWLAKRLVEALVAVIAASAISFLVINLTPGDPAAFILRAQGGNYAPTEAQLVQKREELGLERPVLERYGQWLAGAAFGDLGASFRTGEPALKIIGERLPASLFLAFNASLIGLAFAVVLAVTGSLFANQWSDRFITAVLAMLSSLPSFAVCLIAVDVICIRFKLLPLLSDGSFFASLLPAGCLVLSFGAWWAQLLRSSMLATMAEPFVTTALARGSTTLRAVVVHALPIAMVSALGTIASGIGILLGGTAIVEAVFNWPGVGSLLVRAIHDRDLPLIQALSVLAMMAFVLLALLSELIVRSIDTRHQQVHA